jgi:hypothetical protein
MIFTVGPGGPYLIFTPKEQLHIHSPGGRTIAQPTRQRDFSADHEYYASEAAKKLKRKGYNRGDSLKKITSKVREIIPKAAKRKAPLKETGRGAPGMPRTPITTEIYRLVKEDRSKKEILDEVIKWAQANSINVAGPYKARIKKRVDWWWIKIKSAHK